MTTLPEPTWAMIRANWPLIVAFCVGLVGYVEMQSEVKGQTKAIEEIKATAAREREQGVRMLVELAGIRAEIIAVKEELRRANQRAERSEPAASGFAPARLAEPVLPR